MILLIYLLVKFVSINYNDPYDSVYIYNFQHRTEKIYLNHFISVMPFCHTLFILFLNLFIYFNLLTFFLNFNVFLTPDNRELYTIKYYVT